MTTPPVGVERRIGQRFPFNLPVSLREVATASEGLGFTQDLSSRGAFLFTDMALSEGAEIELTLEMPSEITLGENMRVRCRGSVLRIVKPTDHAKDSGWKRAASAETDPNLPGIKAAESKFSETKIGETRATETKIGETKIGVAVCLKGYEYLPEAENGSPDFRRISALHSPGEAQRPAAPAPLPGTPRVAAS
ncbi:MAG TPA: PilZ domain-containing protein [Verrucomicrobiae bacterium]|jgi:PilZ domain|nr:PilZ domain-containing protein [Verrucomicrobiae bacterium]